MGKTSQGCANDLTAILEDPTVDASDLKLVAALMRDRGWRKITVTNLLPHAKTLGFKVVGTTIQGTHP
jgi:hypothetical protein